MKAKALPAYARKTTNVENLAIVAKLREQAALRDEARLLEAAAQHCASDADAEAAHRAKYNSAWAACTDV